MPPHKRGRADIVQGSVSFKAFRTPARPRSNIGEKPPRPRCASSRWETQLMANLAGSSPKELSWFRGTVSVVQNDGAGVTYSIDYDDGDSRELVVLAKFVRGRSTLPLRQLQRPSYHDWRSSQPFPRGGLRPNSRRPPRLHHDDAAAASPESQAARTRPQACYGCRRLPVQQTVALFCETLPPAWVCPETARCVGQFQARREKWR